MPASPNIILYGSGLFGRNVSSINSVQLAQVQSSGFTTVILWALHIDEQGFLYYNDTLIASNGVFSATYAYLPDLLNALKESSSSVTTILFSIGGWGVGDFENAKTLLATPDGKQALWRNFQALTAALPIDGFDFDMEQTYDVTTLVTLTRFLSYNGMIVTYCPYTEQDDVWNPALTQVYTWDQQQETPQPQTVQWWNLQCYAGGGGNIPATWVADIPAQTTSGVADPAAFVIPGYDAGQGAASIQNTFAGLVSNDKGINGGFIWNSSEIFDSGTTPQEYAQAIIQGLQGKTTS
ncbi:MAG: hypothetical protein JWM87_2685 [Candidatus Eremiobacteraeota bacterium]|nr:hypothetical protein [Candidatus Eremiobacteraeota bacterium]